MPNTNSDYILFKITVKKKEQECKLLNKLENLEHKLSADEYLQ